MPGEGSVYPLRDRTGQIIGWMAQVELPGSGRARRRYRRRRAPTERDARAALKALQAELEAGVRPSRMTTGAYLEQWVDSVRNLRPSTRHGYAAAIAYHLVPALGHVPLAALSPLDVETALARLAPSMSAKHLRNVHAVLRRALNAAVRDGYVTRNVAGREFVDAPRVPDREPSAYSAAEVRALLDAARGDWLEVPIQVAVGTGLRQGELLGLAWEDIDLERGQLHVRRELVRHGGRYLREELKTGHRSRRSVPLAPVLVAVLRRHRQVIVDAGLVPTATGPVFPARSGAPLNGSWATHRLYALEAAAGLRRLPWKDLRSTFSTRLFEAGVPDRRIADLLGHTRTTTTHGHYIGRSEEWAPAIAAVEALVG